MTGGPARVGIKRSMAAEYSRELGVKVFAGAWTNVRHGIRQGGPPGFGLRRQLVDERGNLKGSVAVAKGIQTDRVILVPGPPAGVAIVLRRMRPSGRLLKDSWQSATGIRKLLGRSTVNGSSTSMCWRRPKTEPLLRVVPTQN